LEGETLVSPVFVVDSIGADKMAENLGVDKLFDPADVLSLTADEINAKAGQVEKAIVGGYPSALAEVSGSLKDSPYEGALVVFMVDDRIIYSLAMCPPGQWKAFRPTFISVVNSFTFFEPEQ